MSGQVKMRDQSVPEPGSVQRGQVLLATVIQCANKTYQRVRVVFILGNGFDGHFKLGERLTAGAVSLYRRVKELFAVADAKIRNRDVFGNERIEVGEVAVRYHLIYQLPQHVTVRRGVCECGCCECGCECGYDCGTPVHAAPFVQEGY